MRPFLAWACFKVALGLAAIGTRLDPPKPVPVDVSFGWSAFSDAISEEAFELRLAEHQARVAFIAQNQ